MGFKARRRADRLPSFQLGGDGELRPLQLADCRELFAAVDANRARLRRWMPWLDTTADESALRTFLADTARGHAQGTALRLAITVAGKIAGVAGLEAINRQHRGAHIGYWVAAEHEGRGLVTASAEHLCRYGFETLGLHIIEIRAALANRRSRAVPERLGFRFEGQLRQREWLYDHYVDHAVYSMLGSEWRASGA
jgi:ribosomal-protein-serine acetyltransferase